MNIADFTALLRDLGIIVAVPVVITILWRLYEARSSIQKAQMDLLAATQYSNARAELESQRELYENQLAAVQEELDDLLIHNPGRAVSIVA